MLNIQNKLKVVMFLQFFVWGAWLITIANYWFGAKGWDGTQFGLVFGTMGVSSLFMPTITGILADKYINAEKLYAILHLLYAGTLFYLTTIDDPTTFLYIMLLAMCFYMPTIALANSISYNSLINNNLGVVKDFPPIRVWGTIGFIIAMWLTNLSGNKATEYQFIIAAAGAILLVLSSLTLPKCPPQNTIDKKSSWFELLGLESFKLFANYKMALFFIFSMLLGAALQLTNAYGDLFIGEFKFFPKYAGSMVVERSTIIMSISQISETLFILAIPFFLKRFGIKKVMLFSMLAWVLRFGLFAYGNPADGLWMIILSCIVYGLAFDFFNISGSLFVETQTSAAVRSSAQGLFMMMTNGFGAVLGSVISGWMIDQYFTKSFDTAQELATYLQTTADNSTFLDMLKNQNISLVDGVFNQPVLMKDWQSIWLVFAVYALIVAVLFAVLFKHKHKLADVENISH